MKSLPPLMWATYFRTLLPDMNKFLVTAGPVDHNGGRYEQGAWIPLSDDSAAPLLAADVIEAAKAAGKEPKPPSAD